MSEYVKTSDVRVWLIKNRAGPANAPDYEGCWMATGVSYPKSDPTIIKCPDPSTSGKFQTVGKVPGVKGMPEATIKAKYKTDASDLFSVFRTGCDADLQFHIGPCLNHQDFNGFGQGKVVVIEAAEIGNYGVGDLGALEEGDQSPVMEETPFKGENLYEILPIAFEEQAEDEAVQEILAIMVCDAVSCGACEDPSDGCEKVFALTITVGGSPGAPAEIIYTGDAGTTWSDTEIDTLGADEDPDDMACVGRYLVVISNDSDSHHYAIRSEILAGTETWAEVGTGYVAAGSPKACFAISPRHFWVVGDGGYVYFSQDITASVSVQTAGTVTTEDLLAIHGYDTENLVAVGENNAVIVTENGGDTWAAITGPNAGANLTAVWMHGKNTWFVGCNDGTIWYTIDGGTNWTQKTLPNQASLTSIEDIKFSTPTVGWIAAKLSNIAHPLAGYIYRTIDGGYTWYVAPEGNTSLPANDYINEIAVCEANPNIIWAGGLADDGSDGIIVKGA